MLCNSTVRFFLVESVHLDLNFKFNTGACIYGYSHLRLIIFSGIDDVPINSEAPTFVLC
jgi:hypothetical protein